MEKVVIRKCKNLTIKEKLKVIEKFDSGVRVKDIASEYEIPSNSVSTIIKNKERLFEQFNKNSDNLLCKRFRKCAYENLERAMELFVQQSRAHNLPLSGPILKMKAKLYADTLKINNFKASDGWLSKFVRRHKLSFKSICGESGDVDVSLTSDWISNNLPSIIKDYTAEDIFNADETALFFKCLPQKTYAFKNDKCLGGKYSKQRVTIMVACNMSGTEKLPLLVIGKSKKPRCFKNVKSLPIIYESNTKAWMNSIIFEKWLCDLDKKFTKQNRKILMFLDNCAAHPKNVQTKLKSINLHFLPPNTTSVLQPLDLGIIKNIKHHYRDQLLRKKIQEMNNSSDHNEDDITILTAINILANVWSTKVKRSTIQHCFEKAGFILNDEDNIPLSVLKQRIIEKMEFNSEIQHMEQNFRSINSEIEFQEYCDVDNDVLVCEVLSDSDIIEAVATQKGDVTVSPKEEIELETESLPEQVDAQTVNKILERLNCCLMQIEEVPSSIFQSYYEIENFLKSIFIK